MLNVALFESPNFSFPKINLGKMWSFLKVTEQSQQIPDHDRSALEQEQPVRIEYVGFLPPPEGQILPEERVFIVHFEGDEIAPEDKEKYVIANDDGRGKADYDVRVFLKSFDRKTMDYEVYRTWDGNKDRIPLWLQKRIEKFDVARKSAAKMARQAAAPAYNKI